MTETTNHYHALLQQYIAICNEALSRNKEVFPYNALCTALNHAAPVQVAIFDDTPKGLFELSVDNTIIQAEDMSGSAPIHQVVRMNISDLQHIIQNREEYIKNPAKIDWKWIRSQQS